MINISNKKVSYLLGILTILIVVLGYSVYQSNNQLKAIEHEVASEYFVNLIRLRHTLQNRLNDVTDINLTLEAVHSFRWNRNAMELGRKYQTNFDIPPNLHKFHSIAHDATFSMIQDFEINSKSSEETTKLVQRTLEILDEIIEITGDNIDAIEEKSLRQLYQDLAEIDRTLEGRVEDGL